MTESGKTTLAIVCARRFKDQGVPRIILDPMNDPRWEPVEGVDWIGDDPEEFTRLWKTNQQCALFVDEGSESIGRYAEEMNQVVTKARHWGHETHVISQRPQQMDPVVREQMSEMYIFRSSPTVAKILADEMADRSILQCTELTRGEFLLTKRFEPASKCYIDVVTQRVTYRVNQPPLRQ